MVYWKALQKSMPANHWFSLRFIKPWNQRIEGLTFNSSQTSKLLISDIFKVLVSCCHYQYWSQLCSLVDPGYGLPRRYAPRNDESYHHANTNLVSKEVYFLLLFDSRYRSLASRLGIIVFKNIWGLNADPTVEAIALMRAQSIPSPSMKWHPPF